MLLASFVGHTTSLGGSLLVSRPASRCDSQFWFAPHDFFVPTRRMRHKSREVLGTLVVSYPSITVLNDDFAKAYFL
jgi:hypothetical protein